MLTREACGAAARPFVTHHNEMKSDMFLRVSACMYMCMHVYVNVCGAAARPFVTHHNEMKSDIFLRVSACMYMCMYVYVYVYVC